MFDVLVYGSASCGDAKRVMRDYFKAARAGKCSGNSCRAKIRRHSCVATPASADTEVAATCTRRPPTDCQHPSSFIRGRYHLQQSPLVELERIAARPPGAADE